MKVFTIGFTKKTAQEFFEALRRSGTKRIVDVRLNNVSQLAGFAKRDDLKFFLKEIRDIDDVHLPDLAPTQEMLDEYKRLKGDWGIYEKRFLDLMEGRRIENHIPRELVAGGYASSDGQLTSAAHSRSLTVSASTGATAPKSLRTEHRQLPMATPRSGLGFS
jgi:hypothetical protein